MIDVDGQSIRINHGYPAGHWNQSVRYLINLDNQPYTPASEICSAEWCGRGNQSRLPSGVRTSTGRIAKIYPRGYRWADNCGVYYLNPQDGTPPIIEVETADCR